MPKTPPPVPPDPARRPADSEADAPAATTGRGTRASAIGRTPPSRTAPSLTESIGLSIGCGDRTKLTFLDPAQATQRIPLAGIDPANLRTAGDAYYEGALVRIGALRAIDELVARFLGGLNLTSGAVQLDAAETATPGLRNNLCNYMRQEPLRVPPEDRDPVLGLFDDETLERLLLRLSDAVIVFDLAARPTSEALTPAAVPVEAARLALLAVIEDLELFLDAKGGGGVSYVTNEVGTQLMEVIQILNDPALLAHVPGNDVDDLFSVIAGLLAGEKDLPTDWEARQLARKASAGRRIFVEISNHVSDGFVDVIRSGPVLEGELQTLAAQAYEWRAAHGCTYIEGVDDAADGQQADENRLKVLRLRPGRIA